MKKEFSPFVLFFLFATTVSLVTSFLLYVGYIKPINEKLIKLQSDLDLRRDICLQHSDYIDMIIEKTFKPKYKEGDIVVGNVDEENNYYEMGIVTGVRWVYDPLDFQYDIIQFGTCVPHESNIHEKDITKKVSETTCLKQNIKVPDVYSVGDLVMVTFGGVETEERQELCKITHIGEDEITGKKEYSVMNVCNPNYGASVPFHRIVRKCGSKEKCKGE